MYRLFARLRELASILTWRIKPAKRRPIRRVKLSVQMLEEREVPANILWIAGADDNWNVAANWGIIGQQGTQLPTDNDVLYFDPNQTGGTKQGTNFNSVCNMAELWVSGIVMGPGYTGTVSINQPLETSFLTFNSGTIDGPATLTVKQGGTWANGTMKGNGITTLTGGTFEIQTNTVTIDTRTFNVGINGEVNWIAGTIAVKNATINNSNSFTANSDNALTMSLTGTSAFNNLGGATFNKKGAGTLEVLVPFNNNLGTVPG